MTLHSDSVVRDAGFSLFETMVALAVLALVVSVTATSIRGPSPAVLLQQQANALIESATLARSRAVSTGRSVALELPGCGGKAELAHFHPDGTADAAQACVTVEEQILKLHVSPLTGRLVVRAP